MISYIIGHKNRIALFEANLTTLQNQTDSDFEVIVVDNSDAAHFAQLKKTVGWYRAHGLTIKVFRVDPTIHPYAHSPTEYGGAYNPALSQNIGVRQASGDIICLTSPEVINAATNVAKAKEIFADGRSHFALGWIDEQPLQAVGSLTGGISVEKIKQLCKVPGNGAMCRDDVGRRPWLPINYFLGFLRKEDYLKVGGIDERFMNSIGWEDNHFAHCLEAAGMSAEFHPEIAGIHLMHSRGYQLSARSNEPLWRQLQTTAVANPGFDWGSSSFITEEF